MTATLPLRTCADSDVEERLSIAFFNNVRDVTPGPQQNIEWEQLVKRLRKRDIREAKDGPLFSLVAMRPGSTRGIAGVTALSGAVLDLDEVPDLAAVQASIAGFEYVLYTTHSHGEKGSRCRLVLPFKRPIAPNEWAAVWVALNELLGGVLDPNASDIARISYLPSCPKSREHLATFNHNRGAWVDPEALLRTSPSVTGDASNVIRLDTYKWNYKSNAAAVGGIRLSPDDSQGASKGSRNDALTRLLGRWFGQGLSSEEALAKAREWNTLNRPPLPDEEVLRTHASIARKHESSMSSSVSPIQPSEVVVLASRRHTVSWGTANAVKPLFSLEAARIDRLISEDPPKRCWLLNGCLPIGKVATLIAPGGTGKSQFMLQLGASVATGSPLAGGAWAIGEPGGVLILFAEDDLEEIHRRMHVISDELVKMAGAGILEKMKERLYVKSMVSESNLMTAAVNPGHRQVTLTDYPWRLIEVARQIPDLKLIIVDPAARFRGGEENSAEDMTRFVEALEIVSKQTGATVLVAHHTNKSSMKGEEPSQTSSRGSSAFTDGVRWQMNLATLTLKEAEKLGVSEEDRRLYLSAHVTKNNYGPPQPPVYLRRGERGYLRKADLARSAAKQGDELVLRVVAQIAKEPEPISATQFENRYGGLDNEFRIGKVKLRGVLNRAVAQGYLEKASSSGRPLRLTDKARTVISALGDRWPDSSIPTDSQGHRPERATNSSG